MAVCSVLPLALALSACTPEEEQLVARLGVDPAVLLRARSHLSAQSFLPPIAPVSEPAPAPLPPAPTTTTTTAAPPPPPPPAAPPKVPSDAQLYRLRMCEAGNDYGAVSPGGWYRGAYQFDRSTWNGVASRWYSHLLGVDPAAASPGDQDAMARALWNERGWQPWPTCGAGL